MKKLAAIASLLSLLLSGCLPLPLLGLLGESGPTATPAAAPPPPLDGMLLFLATDALTLYTFDGTGDPVPLWSNLPGDIGNFLEPPTLSPDGRYVVLPGDEGFNRIVVDILTGELAASLPLTAFPRERYFSPGSTQLAYTAGNKLFVVDLPGGKSEVASSTPCSYYVGGTGPGEQCGDLNFLGWLDDETLLVSEFVGGLPERFEPGSDALRATTTFVRSLGGGNLQTYPRGLIGAAGPYGALVRRHVAGSCSWLPAEQLRSSIRELQSVGPGECPQLSPSGRYAFDVSEGTWQWIDLAQGLAARRSGTFPGESCWPIWSPDESQVACRQGGIVSIHDLRGDPGVAQRGFAISDLMLIGWVPLLPAGEAAATPFAPPATSEAPRHPPPTRAAAHPATDVVHASSSLGGEELVVTLNMRDLPESLEYDRGGVEECSLEYEWGARVDVDNDAATGNEDGFEYALSATYLSSCESEGIFPESGATAYGPISVDVWEYTPEGHMRVVDEVGGTTSVEFDAVNNIIMLSGHVPGIGPHSRIVFFASDYFAGEDVFAP